jgi:hypothetical protein
MDSRAQSRLDVAALAAILLVGTAARLPFLDRPMQLDEAYTYNEYASRPLLDGLSWYTLPNNHLLNTLLVHVATALLGNQRWVVRLPVFVAGLALIPATFAMAARLCGRAPALLAAALVGASEPLIEYSTNARGYTMVALVTVLLVVTADRIVVDSRGGRLHEWVAFTLLPVLGCFAIPIMLYPYGGVVLWLVLRARRPAAGSRRVRLDRLALSGALAALLTIVLYLPALIRTGLGRVAANPYVAPRPLGDVVRELPRTLSLAWVEWHSDWPRLVTALFVLAWAVSLLRMVIAHRGCAAPTKLLLTVMCFSMAAALVQRVVPYDRVWLFALPLYLACIAEGLSGAIARLPLPGPVPQAFAVLLCAGLAFCVVRGESLAPRSWGTLHHGDAITALLGPILRDGDGVVALTPCDAPLKYEFLRQGIPVDYLYDYKVARARRLFVAVDRAHEQNLGGVLAGAGVSGQRFTAPRLVRDFGDAAVFELRRQPATESGASFLSKARPSFTMESSPVSPPEAVFQQFRRTIRYRRS